MQMFSIQGRVGVVLVLAVAVAGAGCGSSDADRDESAGVGGGGASQGSTAAPPRIRLEPVGRFDQPVLALAVPQTDLVAVVEKRGRVAFVEGMTCVARDSCPREPVDRGDAVLDIEGDVSTGSEQGLLGFAFHPSWPDDPRVFINYTDVDGNTRVEAWALDSPSGTASRSRELLRIKQPYPNHNGGHLAFGPDGLLYIGTGDGGDAGDPGDRAQQDDDRLGKLLRIDVDRGGERGYAIPKGNLSTGAPEVWALGLRNPWRFSFDEKTGDLWIGDVGQNEWEEINALAARQLQRGPNPNFQWRVREGFSRFDDTGTTGPGRSTPPVLDYGHDSGCSVTGGVVYRGKLLPALRGWYLFADFCDEQLRLVRAAGVPGSARARDELAWTQQRGAEQVASFGVVQRGEVLVVSLGGTIYQVLPA